MKNHGLLPLKILFGSMCICMSYVVAKTSIQSNLIQALPALNAQPWFNATIIDFYFNITIISIWVIYKEKYWMAAILWILAFVALGSIATSLYVLRQLWSLKDNEPFSKILVRNNP